MNNRPNRLIVESIVNRQDSTFEPGKIVVQFEGIDRDFERTGHLADAMPGDVYEIRRVEPKTSERGEDVA